MAENNKITEKKIPKPIYSDFIIKNGTSLETPDGAYYHFSNVVGLLKAWDRKISERKQANELLPLVSNFVICPKCRGIGYIIRTDRVPIPCPKCRGIGKL